MTEHIEAVQRMQDYIAERINDNITLADLARVAGYSPWHAHRLFTQWLNVTPADYIRRCRLSSAALRLRDENVKITQVAFEIGFESVDGFQRAFLNEFGCNPREYAGNPIPLRLFVPYGIKYSNLERRKGMKTRNIYVQTIEKPSRKVLIKRGVKADDYWSYCQEVGCDVWGLLLSIKSISGEPVCLWLPKKYIKPNTSEYVQGVEVKSDYNGQIPEGFDVIDLPAAKYLVFKGEPFKEEDYEEAITEIWNAIEKYEPKQFGYSWDKENPRIQLEPRGERGYIELMPIVDMKN